MNSGAASDESGSLTQQDDLKSWARYVRILDEMETRAWQRQHPVMWKRTQEVMDPLDLVGRSWLVGF